MKTDSSTGLIWATAFSRNGPGNQASLGTFNPTTGAVRFIGPTHTRRDALALTAASSVAVPALSLGAGILVAILLLALSVHVLLRPVDSQR
jgi:hypothetical protein